MVFPVYLSESCWINYLKLAFIVIIVWLGILDGCHFSIHSRWQSVHYVMKYFIDV